MVLMYPSTSQHMLHHVIDSDSTLPTQWLLNHSFFSWYFPPEGNTTVWRKRSLLYLDVKSIITILKFSLIFLFLCFILCSQLVLRYNVKNQVMSVSLNNNGCQIAVI